MTPLHVPGSIAAVQLLIVTHAQIPFYEPTFRDLILCEIRDAGVDPKCISKLYFSWKDLFIRMHELKEPKVCLFTRKKTDQTQPTAAAVLREADRAYSTNATAHLRPPHLSSPRQHTCDP